MSKPDPKSFIKHALTDGDLLSTFIDKAVDQINGFKSKGGNLDKLLVEVKNIKVGDVEDMAVKAILIQLITDDLGG